MEITYREAQPADAAALLDYMKQVGSESDNLSFGAEGLSFTPDQEAAMLDSISKNPRAIMLLAFDDEEIVGNASLHGSSRPRFSHRYELAITVRKSHWGQGIGTILIEQLISFAKMIGAEVVTLEVRSDNDRAIALYKKFGFEKFGTYRKFFKFGDDYFDAEYMNLYL